MGEYHHQIELFNHSFEVVLFLFSHRKLTQPSQGTKSNNAQFIFDLFISFQERLLLVRLFCAY